MSPITTLTNLVVVVESVFGLVLMALMTGLIFAKFSHPTGRIVYGRHIVMTRFDDKPTLMFRVGNERGNRVVEAIVYVDLMKTQITTEGTKFYRMIELPLVRHRIPALSRSWNLMHIVDEKSPLFGMTPESCAAEEIEFQMSLSGLDDTTGQPVHGQHTYEASHIAWGARFVDILTEEEDGGLVVDLRKFHALESIPMSESLPYTWSP